MDNFGHNRCLADLRVNSWPLILDNESSPVVIACAIGAILLGGRRTLLKGWIALKTLTLNINFLMSIAVIGAVGAIGEWPERRWSSFSSPLLPREGSKHRHPIARAMPFGSSAK